MGNHPKNLLIVESPAKAKTISKYLGKDYMVRASYGHIMDLSTSGKFNLGINIDKNFTPKYRLIEGKKDKLRVIIESAHGIENIYIASDPDREGEAIAWHLADALDSTGVPIHRVLFHEVTSREVKKAVKNATSLNSNLYDSQQARRVLDRIVGFLVSPYLSSVLSSKLSAGRVQSVALRLIVDREKEINNFKSEDFWTINVSLKSKSSPDKIIVANYESTIKDNKKLLKITSDLDYDQFKIVKIDNYSKDRQPLPPLITSALATSASSLYKFTTKKTMQIAQVLYESGLITYMRTDSVRSSKESVVACRKWLKANSYETPVRSNAYKNKSNAQDAHEAIRPTDVTRTPDKVFLSQDELKIYNLIWRRFVASQMIAAKYDVSSVEIQSSSGHKFKLDGRVLRAKGWLDVAEGVIVDRNKKNKMIPSLSEGEKFILNKDGVDVVSKKTKPPSRFSEGHLIKELENKGIGRSSTYAETINKLSIRNYVKKNKGSFFPTEIGIKVIETLVPFFDFMEVKYTAKLERDLDLIANGNLTYIEMLNNFYDSFKLQLKKAYLSQEKDYGYNCDICDERMLLKHGSFGFYLACYNYPDCKNTLSCDVVDGDVVLKDSKLDIVDNVLCPKCSAPMSKRNGKWGPFYSCSKYPRCNGSRKVPFGKKCNKCNGELYATIFNDQNILFCMNYPNCTHSESLPDNFIANPEKLCLSNKIHSDIKKIIK